MRCKVHKQTWLIVSTRWKKNGLNAIWEMCSVWE
jgi:hypothetical protein